MNYVEILRVRRIVVICGACALGSLLVALGIRLATPPATPANLPVVELCLMIAGMISTVVATILGVALACENDGHLELVWSKPTTRTRYALGLILADVTGIAIVFALATLTTLAMGLIYGQALIATPLLAYVIPLSLLLPLCAYALVLALTASIHDHEVRYASLFWCIAIGLRILVEAPVPPILHNVVYVLDFVNPLAYFGTTSTNNVTTYFSPFGSVLNQYGSILTDITGLLLLTLLGVYLAVAQWRRLEIS